MKNMKFTAEMAQAIWAGTKTQTRRMMKPQPEGEISKCTPPYNIGERLYVQEPWTCQQIVAYQGGGARLLTEGEIWQPAEVMERWAARSIIEITALKVEQLQDITEADAKAEGATGDLVEEYGGKLAGLGVCTWRGPFRRLWQKLHGDDPNQNWDANPWVWVYEFKRVEIGGAKDKGATK